MTHEALVEKVAAELSGAPFPSERSKSKARTILSLIAKELEEPDGRMTNAGDRNVVEQSSYGFDCRKVWRAMLSASALRG